MTEEKNVIYENAVDRYIFHGPKNSMEIIDKYMEKFHSLEKDKSTCNTISIIECLCLGICPLFRGWQCTEYEFDRRYINTDEMDGKDIDQAEAESDCARCIKEHDCPMILNSWNHLRRIEKFHYRSNHLDGDMPIDHYDVYNIIEYMSQALK